MRPGTRVGRYEIVGEIGRGAMGAVWRARDPKLGREVAIKTIAAAAASGQDREEVAGRFEREARVAARLTHPGVVGVYDAGHEGDELFLVMELVDGDSLAHRLARGDFPAPAEALEIAAQAADALASAHEAGVIHRDIKPANLLLTRDGRVKVSDFGVAKAIGEQTDLTRTGMMVGSPAYMAPEQVKGMTLDGRSDLFSLGVVLFEMVCGRKPFPADTVTALVYQILHEDPLRDPGVTAGLSSDLSSFLRSVLAKDREERIPDARTFAARARALAAALAAGGGAVETAPTALLARTAPAAGPRVGSATTPRPAAAKPGPGLWIVLVAVSVAVTFGIVLLTRKPAPPEAGRGAEERPLVAQPLAQPPAPERAPDPEPVAPTVAAAVTPAPAEEPRPAPPPTVVAPSVAAATAAPLAEPLAAVTQPEPVPAAVVEPSPAPEPAPAPPISAVFETRRAAEFHVDPEDALVTIDGRLIGKADDWDDMGGGKQWVFTAAGEHLVELSFAGFRTTWIKIVVKPDAEDEVVDIDTDLEEIE
jgi:serine/threonine-protein kinase